jgi:hypothetical protein
MHFFLFIIIFFYGGCTRVNLLKTTEHLVNKNVSCNENVKPKSLKFLEQQYRCQYDR